MCVCVCVLSFILWLENNCRCTSVDRHLVLTSETAHCFNLKLQHPGIPSSGVCLCPVLSLFINRKSAEWSMRSDVTHHFILTFQFQNYFHSDRETQLIKAHLYLVTIRASKRAFDIKYASFFIATCNARVVRFQELQQY